MEQGEYGLSESEFARVRKRVYDKAGISLSEAKRTLVVSRLSKIIRALGLGSFDAYLDFLDKAQDADRDQEFVNALTTNLTRFYREEHHFAHLVEYVGQLLTGRPRKSPNGKPRLRIWSAGCSTGQEPYTITMALMSRYPELKNWDFRVLATDIDTNVLAKAAGGVYPEADLSGLSNDRMKVFEHAGDGSARVPLAMRAPIAFKPLNLMGDWPVKGPFDAIFCRNVAIYFDKPTQVRMFERFAELLADDGFLYIGHSENLGGSSNKFSLVGKTIYQPKAKAGTGSASQLSRGAA